MQSKKGHNFEKLSYKIIGIAINVHKNLGPGFMEVIYQRALAKEFNIAGIEFAREQWIPVNYKNQPIGRKRVDFLCKDLLIEIKAKAEFDQQDHIQTLSYLKATGCEVGLLINFGSRKVEIKRLVNSH